MIGSIPTPRFGEVLPRKKPIYTSSNTVLSYRPMEFESVYEIARTADFIRSRSFTRVALQFPDELLKVSTKVAKALKFELGKDVRLFVMADTAYGSCCVDEVGAAHVDAECVIHYGHSCMSTTSKLPALFVFGKAAIDVNVCMVSLFSCLSTSKKPILVLVGLEYAHTLQNIKSLIAGSFQLDTLKPSISYAEVTCAIINPLDDGNTRNVQLHSLNGFSMSEKDSSIDEIRMIHKSDQYNELDARYGLGGLTWRVPVGQKMEDYLLFWIGSDDQAFANVVLTFNSCDIVRYDAKEGKLLKDFSHQKRILKRRYYLVEKAKDANIVGILVGTLGVAGYLHMIQQMKELIEKAGKKSYTLVMGRPNSAKLANFPECDVFVYVSCAQTALLDSKDFLAPVITPFEAVLAFTRGRQWTGEYVMSFSDLLGSTSLESVQGIDEARFSFLQGGYVEDIQSEGNKEEMEVSLALVEATEKALDLKAESVDSILFRGTARSGADFFAARSFQGLNMEYESPSPQSYLIGRSGKASGYQHEKNNQDKDMQVAT